jgi:hypothetical protein
MSEYPIEPATPEAAQIQEYERTVRPFNPNQPSSKPKRHTVGFHTDEDRYIFFVNVAEMMFRDKILSSNSVSALLEHAAFETCNTYLYDLMRRVKERSAETGTNQIRDSHRPDPNYYHIDPPKDDFF